MTIASVTRQEWQELTNNPRILKAFEILQEQSQQNSIAETTINALYARMNELQLKVKELEQKIDILNSFDINTRLTNLESKI